MQQPTTLYSHITASQSGRQAIILAGGLGTRLRSVVNDVPKCMAPVNGRPFLHYVIEHLRKQGVDQFIFSLGYLGGSISQYLSEMYPDLNYRLCIEEEPLGTGGAIQLALRQATQQDVLALNGDTLFAVDAAAAAAVHKAANAECTLSLKPMQQFERYGVVETDSNGIIQSFKEKKYYDKGFINGGVYMINRQQFLSRQLPQKFSFEKDYLEKFVEEKRFAGIAQDAYFIDIGIPEDFERAQTEFKTLD